MTVAARKPNPIEQRRAQSARRQMARKREAKLAGLSEKARATFEAREAVQAASKAKRTAEDRAKLRAAQHVHAEAIRTEQAERAAARVAAAATLRSAPTPEAAPAVRKAPSARSSTAGETSTALPTVQSLLDDASFRCDPVPMPSIEALATMATTSVVYASASGGLGCWGAGAGRWSQPARWRRTIEQLNQIFHASNGESTTGIGLHHGEYNAVFLPLEQASDNVTLPPFVTADGTPVPPNEIVLRVTRPDQAIQEDGAPYFRYKSLAAQRREFYYTVHGAVHGLAPECLAAVLVPAIEIESKNGTRATHYAALYVLRRASMDVVTLLDEQTKRVRAEHPPAAREALSRALREAGHTAALWLLPLVSKQSRLGVQSFDAKPANYVSGANAQPYAIDFDASMYAIAATEPGHWHANLLMNLLLLTAHVRAYTAPALASGWAAALRPLLLDLIRHARPVRWLFEARISARKYAEILNDTDDDARRRLEMMTHSYFVKPEHKLAAVFRPVVGKQAPSLVDQLARYCLHGSARQADEQLDGAFGKPSVAALRARPWG